MTVKYKCKLGFTFEQIANRYSTLLSFSVIKKKSVITVPNNGNNGKNLNIHFQILISAASLLRTKVLEVNCYIQLFLLP